ncbi:MAG: DUF1902 domain-containing protein [Oscillospiraceae bacterium]|nr:DUF1902 domain-containing protein [Oscillospiraceae bacterium]
MDFVVKMTWDNDARRWAAIGSPGMGLVLESDSFDELLERVKLAAPEMIELNFNYTGPINLYFISERVEHMEAVS